MILPQGKIFNMLRNRLDSGRIIPRKSKVFSSNLDDRKNPLEIAVLF